MADKNKLADYSSLLSTLTRSKMQSSNPQAYQSIVGLIKGAREFQSFTQENFSVVGQTQEGFSNAMQAIIGAIASINTSLQVLQGEIDSLAIDITTLGGYIVDLYDRVNYFMAIDTGAGPQSVDLSTDYLTGYLIIKDAAGNASVNNITVIGTVDGVVDPVINTDFGVIRVFRNDGNFYNW